MIPEDYIARTEIVLGSDRIHVAPRFYEEQNGYWPHYLLHNFDHVNGVKLHAITEVIEASYDQIGEEVWLNPIVCIAAATAIFLDLWNGYTHYLIDRGQAP